MASNEYPSKEELIARLGNCEDNFTERKPEGVAPRELRNTLVAFANTVPEGRAAVLYVGVLDNGDVMGVRNPDTKQRDLRRLCEEDCSPPIRALVDVLEIEGKNVVAVVVPWSNSVPHFTGNAYVRKGSESVRAAGPVLDELFALRNSKTRRVLEWKGEIVTVVCFGRRLGSHDRRASSFYEERECVVEGCDAHAVRLQLVDSQRYVAEPLDRVEISVDRTKADRLKLIVDRE
jgi:hypothetical protein